jgi:hypothetical protein
MSAPTRTGPGQKRNRPHSLAAGAGRTSIELAKQYHVAQPTPTQIAAWQREAIRLAKEYLRTGREIHGKAFEKHVAGMLLRLRQAIV